MSTAKPATSTAARLAHMLGFFGAGVADQVLLSGANFIAGFLMVRYTDDADYGQFVLAQSALLLLVSAQGAWLSGPLSTIVPHKPPETKRVMIGAVRASQARFVRWVALSLLAIVATLYGAGLLSVSLALVIGTTILAGWATLQREYLRSVLLIYSRPHWMLRADASGGVYHRYNEDGYGEYPDGRAFDGNGVQLAFAGAALTITRCRS